MTASSIEETQLGPEASRVVEEIGAMTQEMAEAKERWDAYKNTLPDKLLENFETMEGLHNKYPNAFNVCSDELGRPYMILDDYDYQGGYNTERRQLTIISELGLQEYDVPYSDAAKPIKKGEWVITPMINEQAQSHELHRYASITNLKNKDAYSENDKLPLITQENFSDISPEDRAELKKLFSSIEESNHKLRGEKSETASAIIESL